MNGPVDDGLGTVSKIIAGRYLQWIYVTLAKVLICFMLVAVPREARRIYVATLLFQRSLTFIVVFSGGCEFIIKPYLPADLAVIVRNTATNVAFLFFHRFLILAGVSDSPIVPIPIGQC